MREPITIDMTDMLNSVSVKVREKLIPKDFENIRFSRNDNKLHLVRVIDEDAYFISLFGVFVDINSGNIALGYFPCRSDYILVDNIYDEICEVWGISDKLRGRLDWKYILQLMKISPEDCLNDILMSIKDSEGIEHIRFDSVILQCIKKIESSRISVIDALSDKVSDKSNFIKIFNFCYSLSIRLERWSESIFKTHSIENSDELIDRYEMSVGMLLGENKPVAETLMRKLLLEGYDITFLSALNSYKFKAKKRRKLLMDKIKTPEEKMKSLSSMCYDTEDDNKVFVYNFIDLVFNSEIFQTFLFSVEMSRYGSLRLLDSFLKRFHVDDILKEKNLNKKMFIENLFQYIDIELIKRDCRVLQDMNPEFEKYYYTSNIEQIRVSGEIFESMSKLINKL